MALTGCYTVLKVLVIIINLLFWLTGLAVMVVATWMLVDPTFYVSVAQNESSYYAGLYILLGIGCLAFIVGLFGCCGAYKESQCMLVTFFCLLLIIVVGEIAGGVWAWNHSEDLEKMVRDNVKKTVQMEYGEVQSRTIAFDGIQRALHCCGANGPSDWSGSKYNTGEKGAVELIASSLVGAYTIPTSCCNVEEDDVLCQTGRKAGFASVISSVIHNEGCIDKLISILRSYGGVVIGVTIGLGIVQFLGLVFSMVLCCAVRAIDRYKA
ncbi:CD9 antigen-like [Ischnura elegans]|uniref:CD9 antigen-like n=1 Tax=Ischnura elegans TaxID=197161 RepID=UPI001ED86C71|nr:CD9 antigen-like [Ischnura elegans]